MGLEPAATDRRLPSDPIDPASAEFAARQNAYIVVGATTDDLRILRDQGIPVQDWDRIVELLEQRGLAHRDFKLPIPPPGHNLRYCGGGSQHNCLYNQDETVVYKFPGFIGKVKLQHPGNIDKDGVKYYREETGLDRLTGYFRKAIGVRAAASLLGITHLDPWIDGLGYYRERPLPSAKVPLELSEFADELKHRGIGDGFMDLVLKFMDFDRGQLTVAYKLAGADTTELFLIDGFFASPATRHKNKEPSVDYVAMQGQIDSILSRELTTLFERFDRPAPTVTF